MPIQGARKKCFKIPLFKTHEIYHFNTNFHIEEFLSQIQNRLFIAVGSQPSCEFSKV